MFHLFQEHFLAGVLGTEFEIQGGLPKRQCGSQEQPNLSVCPHKRGPFLSDTTIADHLLEFYRDTDYQVHGREPFSLTIGKLNEPLLRLFKQHRCDCAGFIPACNPCSQMLEPKVNAQRHRDFMTALIFRSLIFIEGVGLGKDPDLPSEASYPSLSMHSTDSPAGGACEAVITNNGSI